MAAVETHWTFTTRREGDFGIDGDPVALERARHAVVPLPWVWLHQVHGPTVHVVTHADAGEVRGADGDGLVTAEVGLAIAVHTADCAPVLFVGQEEPGGRTIIGAAHAGWRGLVAGVIQETVAAMRGLGATDIRAELGPCISPRHYAFGEPELSEVTAVYGRVVRGETDTGGPALDMPMGVTIACLDAGLAPDAIGTSSHACTATHGDRYYSWRARQDRGRMAAVIWNQQAPDRAR